MNHHHEERFVLGLTIEQVARLAEEENIPPDAVFDAAEGEMPMISPSQGNIIEPVLTWRVEDPDEADS